MEQDPRCSMCKKVKPRSDFYSDKSKKNKLSSRCIACSKKASKKRHAENREADNEKSRQWYQNNKERARENRRRWDKENPEKTREINRRKRAKHPERYKGYARKGYYKKLGREVPDELQIPQGPTQLYVIRDWTDTPIYVGICQEGGFEERMKQHRRNQPWGNVIPWQPKVEKTFPTREEAFAAERTRILWYERRGIELFNRADNPFFSKERYVDLFWKLLGQAQKQPDTQT